MGNDESLVLRVDLASHTPVFRQIADGLRAMLVHGTFKPGDRLPTVRQVAIDLAVHHNTVAQAYRLLEDEGWLDLRRHLGATVVNRPTQTASAASATDFSQRLRELTARAMADGIDPKTIALQLNTMLGELHKLPANDK